MIKRGLSLLFLIFLISSCFLPVFADNNNGIGSLEVNIGSSGGVSIKGEGIDNTTPQKAWQNIFDRYRNIIVGVSGIATITMLGVFVVNFMNLGIKASNPNERNRVIVGLIWSGVATTLLASVTIVVGFFWNALK